MPSPDPDPHCQTGLLLLDVVAEQACPPRVYILQS